MSRFGLLLGLVGFPGILGIQHQLLLSRRPNASSVEAHRDGIWVVKNGNLMQSGFTSDVAPRDLSQGPTWTWEEPDFGVVGATPLIDNDHNIYLAIRSGRVYKFEGSSGNLLWMYQASDTIYIPNRLPGVPALMDGMIFNVIDDGTVFALDMETGKLRWSTDSQEHKPCKNAGMDSFSILAADGIVLLPCNHIHEDPALIKQGNEGIVALDSVNGSLRWSFTPDFKTYNLMLAAKDGKVFFEDSTGGTYCLKLSDGSLIWKNAPPGNSGFTTGGATLGPNGIMYSTSNVHGLNDSSHGLVSAYQSINGKIFWRTQLELEANSAPAIGYLAGQPVGSLSVLLAVGDNPDWPALPWEKAHNRKKLSRAFALDALTGKVQWEFIFPDWYGSAAGDTYYKGHICLPDSYANPTIGGDGTAYLVGESGIAYALRDDNADGTIREEDGEVYKLDTKNAFQASPAIAPGMLVLAPCNGLAVFLSSDGR